MLSPGARIAVISPSGISAPARLDAGIQELERWGYRPALLPRAHARERYFAGTDDERLADLHLAFSGEFDAVWMARGGYGLARLLPRIAWENLAPVPFFGFSDGTVMLNALAARGRPAVHAPVLHALATHNDDSTRLHLRALLTGCGEMRILGENLRSGSAEGPLAGGNLCVLASMCGTPGQLDARGRIVVLEDLGEAAYKIDRLLVQLRDSGALNGAIGLVLGDFLDANVPADAAWSLDDVFRDVLGPLGLPILRGVPIGHGKTNLAFPLGAPAALEHGALTVYAR
ncbi:peptidase S66 [Deltaproteobacteria bacterium]|nr:peptidase S66 [Deltaproteobacteria bacterium]